MYERMLLESGKVSEGRRVSGVGANVVDDSRTIHIYVSIPEGIADIVSVTAPTMFTPGVAFPIGITISNIGGADMLFVRITNVDTSEVLGEQQIYVTPGQAPPTLSFILTLLQTADFNGLIEAGHVE